MDTNIYIACLRQVVAFAPKVTKMRRLRRRTREGQKSGCRFMNVAYEVKNKREKIRCLLLRQKKNFYIYIYDVITWGEKKKALHITTHPTFSYHFSAV